MPSYVAANTVTTDSLAALTSPPCTRRSGSLPSYVASNTVTTDQQWQPIPWQRWHPPCTRRSGSLPSYVAASTVTTDPPAALTSPVYQEVWFIAVMAVMALAMLFFIMLAVCLCAGGTSKLPYIRERMPLQQQKAPLPMVYSSPYDTSVVSTVSSDRVLFTWDKCVRCVNIINSHTTCWITIARYADDRFWIDGSGLIDRLSKAKVQTKVIVSWMLQNQISHRLDLVYWIHQHILALLYHIISTWSTEYTDTSCLSCITSSRLGLLNAPTHPGSLVSHDHLFQAIFLQLLHFVLVKRCQTMYDNWKISYSYKYVCRRSLTLLPALRRASPTLATHTSLSGVDTAVSLTSTSIGSPRSHHTGETITRMRFHGKVSSQTTVGYTVLL